MAATWLIALHIDSIAKYIGEPASFTCEIIHQEYKKLLLRDLKRIRKEIPEKIIGQFYFGRQ